MTIDTGLILIFLVSVALNAFFAGYETGFIASNPIRVRHLAETGGHPRARRLLEYLEAPERMITLVLAGTSLALVAGTLALTVEMGALWAALIAVPVFLVFGEVLPKSMFRAHPTQLTLFYLPVVRLFDMALAPVSLPISWISRSFLAIVNAKQHELRSMLNTSDDVRVLVDESAHHGNIDADEKEMIHSVMDLHSRHAYEVMVPRTRIKALPDTATRKQLVELLRETGFTRIPIYNETIDRIIGVVSAFAVLTDTDKANPDIRRFMVDVIHVPDTMRLDDLLEELRRARTRIAIVTDEYGGTDGLVTVEDILEEIFGEFHDEHDQAEEGVRKIGPNKWLLDARTALSDANELMPAAIQDDEVDTIGGWVMHLAGRIPEAGELVESGPYKIEIIEATPQSVGKIRLEIAPDADSEEEEW
jgi:CBS domain containing-hemolysin-like protein